MKKRNPLPSTCFIGPKAAYENYSEIDPAKAWREQWADDAKAPQVKILYDVTEAEITVLGKYTACGVCGPPCSSLWLNRPRLT